MTNFELIQKHVQATGVCSIMAHMRNVSPTYNEIISKGKDILPDVLNYLRDNNSGMNVMLFLWDITKSSPYKPERVGETPMMAFDVHEARKAWIEWGIKENIIK